MNASEAKNLKVGDTLSMEGWDSFYTFKVESAVRVDDYMTGIYYEYLLYCPETGHRREVTDEDLTAVHWRL